MPRRRSIVWALVVAQILIATTSTGLLPNRWAEMAQVYGAFVGAFIAILFALASQLRGAVRAAAEVAAPPVRSAAA
jgi:hypothetical protein